MPISAAHRGADPVHALDVEARDQRHHVGDVLRQLVEHRIGEPVGIAAPGDVRADDPVAVAQRRARACRSRARSASGRARRPARARFSDRPIPGRRCGAGRAGEAHCTKRCRELHVRPVPVAGPLVHQPAALDRHAALRAVLVPLAPRRAARGTRALAATKVGNGRPFASSKRYSSSRGRVVLGVRIGVGVAHQQPADALAEFLEAARAAGDADDRPMNAQLRRRT